MSSFGLKIGIVGLPNVGKSTLFNALLKKQQAYVANFPFATIEPNIGVVLVPDNRLKRLSQVVKESEKMDHLPLVVPATVEFIDIAGLVKGAHKGEGLGNKFLSHIREVDAICHVIRAFSDSNIVKQGTVNPKTDFETIETEIALADLQTMEKQKDPGSTTDKDLKKRWEIIQKLKKSLESGTMVRTIVLNDKEQKVVKELNLLTEKPILTALNVNESELKNVSELESKFARDIGLNHSQVIAISAKVESELSSLTEDDQKAYLEDLDVKESGLERLIKKAFETLGLITFLTAGEKEVRAWTLRLGETSLSASGHIHTDFMKNFIKADVVSFGNFIEYNGWNACREFGMVRSEGRDYQVKDGDVIEFKVGQ